MTKWLVLVCLVVLGATVLVNSDATFIENLSNPVSRIVSGWESKPGQFPHQLSLRMVNSTGHISACGGSVISAGWGLTAAHCTAKTVKVTVCAGTVNLKYIHHTFEAANYYNYPLYDESRPTVVQHNDIGLLEFGIELVFNKFIKPIRLQRSEAKDRDYDGKRLVVSGWGRTSTNGTMPDNMKWVYLLGKSNKLCSKIQTHFDVKSTICASHYNVTGQLTCQGDSGGPLSVIDDDGEYSMIGVASFTVAYESDFGKPAGFTRPGYYHEWYTNITGINFDWKYKPKPPHDELFD